MSLSSGTNGSQALKKKIPIRMLTIALFAIGGLIAAVAIYQQYTIGGYAISHREAIRIALVQVDKEQDRDAAYYPNEEAGAKLIHVTDTGMGYIVDEYSRTDMVLYSNEKFVSGLKNTSLWHVNVETFNDLGEGREYWYLIDTSSGKIVGDYLNEPYEIS
jgi:hypothetical protein